MGINKDTGLIYNDSVEEKKVSDNNGLADEKLEFSLTQKDYRNLFTSFEDFINQDIEDLWDNYNIGGKNLIVRVFTFNPTDFHEDTPDIALGMISSKELKLLTFPVAIVLNAGRQATYINDEGEEVNYKKGDFVKLQDRDARMISNPDYEAWIDNGMSNSNATQIGQAPPSKIAALRRNFAKYTVMANPFDFFVERKDLFTFNLPLNYIDGYIKDVNKFLDV